MSSESNQIASWRRPPAKVFIVLPAFNEEQTLGALLRRIDEALTDDGISYEILVVNDGSVDRTLQIAEEFARLIPVSILSHPRNQGLGATIRDGLYAASQKAQEKDIVIAMDADDTHSPGLIRRMTRLIGEGNDVVIASRYRPGSEVRGLSWHRRLLSLGGNVLLRIVFPTRGVRDFTSGYRAYRAPLLRQAFDQFGSQLIAEDGFSCMVDLLLKLRRIDAIFGEVPLILRYDRKQGKTKLRVWSTIGRTLRLIVKRRFGH